MKTYLEGNIFLNNTDDVKLSLLMYNEVRIFTIGISHKGKYTFLLNGKDYFSNGCQYNCANDCIGFIKSNFKNQIREGYKPYICVNGKEVNLFMEVSEFVD